MNATKKRGANNLGREHYYALAAEMAALGAPRPVVRETEACGAHINPKRRAKRGKQTSAV